MIEKFKIRNKNGKAYIALVTMVPAVVEALTGEKSLRLNKRHMSKMRLTDVPYFMKSLKSEEQPVVDLFFIPTVTGHWDILSNNNIAEVASSLSGYDLIVDVCELTALYRRGDMPETDLQREVAPYPNLSPKINKNFVDYKGFLEVLVGLTGLLKNLRGRIIRPRIFNAVNYEWDRDKNSYPRVEHFSVLLDWSTGDKGEGWAELKDAPADIESHQIVAGSDAAVRQSLDAALEPLHANGMETLQHRVLLSAYMSDLAGMVARLIGSGKPSEYTSTPRSIFANRREKTEYDTFSPEQKEVIEALEAQAESALSGSTKKIHLVDYLQLSGGRDGKPSKRGKKFRNVFQNAFAFLTLWDFVESECTEDQLNEKINGWYMANSSHWVLRQAVEAHGLARPITSWALPTLVTNSLGLLPEYDDYIAEIIAAISREIDALATEHIPA